MRALDKKFVPYLAAKDLKELGFNEPCFATYRKDSVTGYLTGNPFNYGLDYHTKVQMDQDLCPKNSDYTNDWVSAATYEQAFDFFREEFNFSRPNESYLVAVPSKSGRGHDKLYWPNQSLLKQHHNINGDTNE